MTMATAEKKFVVLATDKHRCGQPIRAISENCQHLMSETRSFKFIRFATREEGERWLRQHMLRLRADTYTYTVTDL